MFGYLELSNRRDFNMKGFCFSFKDYNQLPVNTGVQKDAQEFLNQIFEKLEQGLKMTPFMNIMQGIYGGRKNYKTVCKNCGAVSTRKELFYNLSLKVKNLTHIYESLSEFIKEEFISDYKCEACK